jgi:hypothetical protein
MVIQYINELFDRFNNLNRIITIIFKLIGNKYAKIEINNSLQSFSFYCGNVYGRVYRVVAGMARGPEVCGWQHCRGG